MKIMNLKWYILTSIMGIFLLNACQDDFDEKDFLEQQAKLAKEQKQLEHDLDQEADSVQNAKNQAAMEEASRLKSLTVQIVEDDESPVAGIEITAVTQDVNGDPVNETMTTGADGTVIFPEFPKGSATLHVVAPNGDYINGKAVIDTGDPEYEIIDGQVVPRRTAEAIQLTLFPLSGGTATITGRVEIETDVTNNSPEVPQEMTINANLNSSAGEVSSGVVVLSYQLDDGSIGTATTDATTGEFTMEVPATEDGIFLELLFPEITATQKIAIKEVDGVEIDPMYDNIETSFGPAFNFAASDNIPNVPGAKAVFPDPPAPGQGFAMNFARKPRGLGNWIQTNLSSPFEKGNIRYRVTDRGIYSSSPSVTINGDGTDALMKAAIQAYVLDINVSDEIGIAGHANDQIRLRLVAKDGDDVEGNLFNTISYVQMTVTADASGDIQAGSLTLPNTFGFSDDQKFNTGTDVTAGDGFDVQSFKIDFYNLTDGMDANADYNASVTVSGEISALKMEDGGMDYTEITGIEFTGSNPAKMEVMSFASQWEISLDNSGVTPYPVMPGFDFELFALDGDYYTNDATVDDDGVLINPDLEPTLILNSNGEFDWSNPAIGHFTSGFSVTEPRLIIDEVIPETAEADINVNSNGNITLLYIINNGSGYDNKFTVSIEPAVAGASGSGAIIELIGGNKDPFTGEYSWPGTYTILEDGQDYLQNLNQTGKEGWTGTQNLLVKSGQTYNIGKVNYGTGGARVKDVN